MQNEMLKIVYSLKGENCFDPNVVYWLHKEKGEGEIGFFVFSKDKDTWVQVYPVTWLVLSTTYDETALVWAHPNKDEAWKKAKSYPSSGYVDYDIEPVFHL